MPRLTTAQRDAIATPATGLTIFNTDCKVYNYNAGTPGSPVWATINASNVLVAGVSIVASPVGAICAGASVTFTATPSNGINSPSYQWQVNGGNVGTNSATYTTTSLNNGDVVTCLLSTSEACVSGSPATSNAITMAVNIVPSITGTTSTGFCSGSAVTLGASANLGTINWYANATGGSSLSSGASFTIAGLNATTTYYVDATANGCTTPSRTPVTATFYPNTPGQPGAISGPATVNKNDTATYSVNAVNNAATYSWTVTSGTITSGQGTTSILVTWPDSSSIGSVSVAATNPCGTSASQSISIGIQELIFAYTGNMQTFTVGPTISSLTIEAFGAQGGSTTGENGAGNWTGGLGADIKGTFAVNNGQVIDILVGGQGGYGGCSCASGGGGGSWAVSAGQLLLVAGGGGGGFNCNYYGGANGGSGQAGNNGGNGVPAPTASAGHAGGTGGSGGSGCYGGGGGGWYTNGTYSCGGVGGQAYPGAAVGNGGGYGGGGGGYGGCCGGSGCGGGYSGGSSGNSDGCAGGGGGSYNTGTNQTNNAGVRAGNGLVIVTW